MPKPPIPSVGEMIKTHTLAFTIIDRHPDAPDNVLDPSELALLRRFCADPSKRDEILREHDMTDEPGDRPGTRARTEYGSLVGYCIARHGTDNPAFNDEEVEMLRKWFESGGADFVE